MAATRLESPAVRVESKMAPAFTRPWIATVGLAWFSWIRIASPFGSTARVGWTEPARAAVMASGTGRLVVAHGARGLAQVGARHAAHILRRDPPDVIQIGVE